MDVPAKLLRASEVARILDVPVSSVYEAARQKRIGGVIRFGRQVRFDSDKFEAWLEAGGESLPGGWRQVCQRVHEKREPYSAKKLIRKEFLI